MIKQFAAVLFAVNLAAADLPIREIVLYKHGVGYFQRSGNLAAGETAQLDFNAESMNDVLKSLTIVDGAGNAIAGIRYDAAESIARRIQDFPFAIGERVSLAVFLDQMKGARLELRTGAESVTGTIVSGRTENTQNSNKEYVVLLTDAGDIRTFDLSAATSVRLSDPKQQSMLRDYLSVIGSAQSRDRRSLYIDGTSGAARQVSASYMVPTAVWKSSYRLIFGAQGKPTLEGWAIVDNTSGEDWNGVRLSVVSGRPISFITELYEPRYVDRPRAELAENRPVGPQVFEGVIGGVAAERVEVAPTAPPQLAAGRLGGMGGARQERFDMETDAMAKSSITPNVAAANLGELFEYRFSQPVTVKQGESAMLPFLQEEIDARKLLIYSESFNSQNPMNAAELTNSTGKTLDGGPITVYDANAYAGEALVETVKAGDKRLISYGVDLGTRITTKFDSSSALVREIHFRRGILTTRNSIQETRTFTINNVDGSRKTLVIEHPKRPGYELAGTAKPSETTANNYRFEVALGARATETFAIQEERVFEQSYNVTNVTPDLLTSFIQNRSLSAAARTQLEQILAKKNEIAANQAQQQEAAANLRTLTEDENRIRQNIQSLRQVAGQEAQVQQYARQLAEAETRIASLRDEEARLRRVQASLQAELNQMIERADF